MTSVDSTGIRGITKQRVPSSSFDRTTNLEELEIKVTADGSVSLHARESFSQKERGIRVRMDIPFEALARIYAFSSISYERTKGYTQLGKIEANANLDAIAVAREDLEELAPDYKYKVYTEEYDQTLDVATEIPSDEVVALSKAFLTHSSAVSAAGVQDRLENFNFSDAAITFLVNNSGSMRGRPISIAALACYKLAQAFEERGAVVEVLGYTTNAWKGGRAREKWLKDDKPLLPGRLNERLHIIYKPWNRQFSDVGENIAYMTKEINLKENLDGEAVEWAAERLRATGAKKLALAVIGDGAPVDDSTLAVNPPSFLSDHLQYVVNKIARDGKVMLFGIGIGHNVEKIYERSAVFSDIEEFGKKGMLDIVDEMGRSLL